METDPKTEVVKKPSPKPSPKPGKEPGSGPDPSVTSDVTSAKTGDEAPLEQLILLAFVSVLFICILALMIWEQK